MNPVTPLLLFIALGLGVFLSACDMSENDALLNPDLSDSSRVRIVNLTGGTISSVSIEGVTVGSDVPPSSYSAAATLWFPQRVTMIVTTPDRRDTIERLQLGSAPDDPILNTFVVTRIEDSLQVVQLVSGRSESDILKTAGEARVYFLNGADEGEMIVREGCRNGAVLFTASPGSTRATSRDLTSGDYSLYLFEDEVEAGSARISLDGGSILGVVATSDGSGNARLTSLDLGPDAGASAGTLAPLPPEDRTTGSITLINSLLDDQIDAEMLGTGEQVVSGLPPGEVSDLVTLAVCQTPSGDTLRIRTAGGDTALVAFSGVVGGSTRLVVFDNGSGIGAVSLPTYDGPTDDRIRVRAVNLASADTTFSIVAGAGAPGSLNQGDLLFSTLRNGRLSEYLALDAGLYPLALEYSTSGLFVDGGLHRMEPGAYTFMVLSTDEGPSLRILSETGGSGSLEELDVAGRRSILFSGNPGSPVEFRIGTSIGELVATGIAHSYVFPTVIPEETVSVSAGGRSSSIAIGTAGSIIGWAGRSDEDGELISFDRLDVRPNSGEAILRFLNAVPGSDPLSIRSDSSKGPVVTTISWPTPSEPITQEARRLTYVITPEGTNDELARVTGVQLSGERSYVLLVVPSGASSTTGREYSTIFLQE